LIESIRIKNFQSLRDVELEFGKLTVIVGASSSGKSALTRAMKAIAMNSLDSDYITRGTKVSAITVKTSETSVTIEREIGGSSVYKVAKSGSEESRFTKLNRQVPSEVTEALGISPGTQEVASINFAGQFDAPYLLKEGSSSVARVLGELTNVSTIFNAVKEASRRAKNASGLVNIRKKDQDKLLLQLGDYANVMQQAKSITQVEALLAQATTTQARMDLLANLIGKAKKASEALEAVRNIPALPDIAELEKAYIKFNKFKNILKRLAQAQRTIVEQDTSIESVRSGILLAENELHDTLTKAGRCPTCNQEIHA